MSSSSFNPSTAAVYGWVLPRNPSPYVRALLLYIGAIERWNYNDIMALFDESLQHWTLPLSLCRPVLNKRQYGEYLKAMIPTFKHMMITIHEVIEGDSKLAVHVSSESESLKGTKLTNECTLMMHFIPKSAIDGPDALPKITIIKEFMDGAALNRYFAEEKVKLQDIGQKQTGRG